jgi:hypothetical protein
MKRERRYIPATELRVNQESGEKIITGYAVVYNSLSEDMGFREMVAPGTFTDFLKTSPDVRCLYNHSENHILGRTTAGTLTITDDSHGVAFRCVLPNNSVGNDLAVSIERGDVNQCSFGFICEDAGWSNEDGYMLRTIKSARLLDVSPVVFPAYTDTSVGLRSMFPDGNIEIPEIRNDEPVSDEPLPDVCNCDCPECQAGDCADCSMDSCSDVNCRCSDYRTSQLLVSLITRKLRTI